MNAETISNKSAIAGLKDLAMADLHFTPSKQNGSCGNQAAPRCASFQAPAIARCARRRDNPQAAALKTGRQIRIYLLNPLKTLYFQGISPILCSNLMYFPLFLPLRAETRESFLLSADHLIQQSCGSTLRFPCSVSVNVHCGTDISVSEKFLHIFRCCTV